MAAEGLGGYSISHALKWVWLTVVQLTGDRQQKGKKGQNAQVPRSMSDSSIAQSRGIGRKQMGNITWEEIGEHATEDDCWVVIRGKVYDVTRFGQTHPGGRVIFTQGGRDATDLFTSFHSKSTWSLLKHLHVGDIDPELDSESPGILQDFRDLRAKFIQLGLFDASKAYYAFKLVCNIVLLTGAIGMLMAASAGIHFFILSAVFLGFFFQQSGWLAHDFLHHQVFDNRAVNNFLGYVTGNVAQGFSVDWWKSKHNTHHAVPNELDDSMDAVDPDIDTLPLLAWSSDMLETVPDEAHRKLIRIQHYLFFPVLTLARLSWAQQSILHACKLTSTRPAKGWLELGLLVLHYTWSGGVAFSILPPLKALLYLLLAQCLCGVLLGIAFVQSHNGMEVYSDKKDFVSAQVVSTRDIAYNFWVHWFMGGLNYQIEHHLFPTMPRHNLGKIQPFVKNLCDKYGLPYEECNMLTGTKRVLERLSDVAKEA